MRSTETSTPLLLLALLGLAFAGLWFGKENLAGSKNPSPEGVEANWLYQRESSGPSSAGGAVELILVGDVLPARIPSLPNDLFSEVSRELSAADLAIGNLEGVLVAPDEGSDCYSPSALPAGYRILIPVGAVKGLQAAGFDLLGLANNHARDCGERGLSQMVGILERAGIQTAGTVQGSSGEYQASILTAHGLRIAVLAFTAIRPNIQPVASEEITRGLQPAGWEPGRAMLAVQGAQAEADFVIAWLHWGEEYSLGANLWQRETARKLVDAGADMVVGHHPHVVQETQVLERSGEQGGIGFVAYSLGNFVFDQYEPNPSQGLVLKVLIDGHGLKAVGALPVKTSPRPRWLDDTTSQDLVRRIQPDPRRSGYACGETTCEPVEVGAQEVEGSFWRGSIDLTGDGREEVVWLHQGIITIYSDQKLAWTSPAHWTVVDLALGDPNDDGRYEILAAVNGMRAGERTSQPFILGYRGGIYRQLWGGSPVSEAILEVELGDVDFDGRQELVVIEERSAGKQALAVWDWHGWGFSLFWRSPEDRFSDLAVLEPAGGQQVITVGLTW